MSLLVRLLPVCAVMLCATVPAVAGQSAPPATTAAPAPTPGTAQADHQTYTRRAESETEQWGAKLQAFHAQADAKGEKAAAATEAGLQEAWGKVKVATHGLQTAGDETWEGAKHAYEAADDDLASAWRSAGQHL
jgi:hypothetical protein